MSDTRKLSWNELIAMRQEKIVKLFEKPYQTASFEEKVSTYSIENEITRRPDGMQILQKELQKYVDLNGKKSYIETCLENRYVPCSMLSSSGNYVASFFGCKIHQKEAVHALKICNNYLKDFNCDNFDDKKSLLRSALAELISVYDDMKDKNYLQKEPTGTIPDAIRAVFEVYDFDMKDFIVMQAKTANAK